MKKALFILALLMQVSVMGDEISQIDITYHNNYDYYTMGISGNFDAPVQIFLNIDNNENTGYTNGGVRGADRLIEIRNLQSKSNQVYTYEGENGSSWEWSHRYQLSNDSIWTGENTLYVDLDRGQLGMSGEAQNDRFSYRIQIQDNGWNEITASYPDEGMQRYNNTTSWTTGAYEDNEDRSQVLSINGAESLTVTVNGVTEEDYDFIYIYDKDGNQITQLSGQINETLTVQGDTITVRLTSDEGFTESGVTVSIMNKKDSKKKLILAQGDGWTPSMVSNLINNKSKIENLPFDGFTMIGTTYTSKVMREGFSLDYNTVYNEVKNISHLYDNTRMTDNFMLVYINFPGDFWDDGTWEQVVNNFAVVAKVAKEIGFKGIAFDDEPYERDAFKMVNFKFPKPDTPDEGLEDWEIAGKHNAKSLHVDYNNEHPSYRNQNYNFKEHMKKVTERFRQISEAMVNAFPEIVINVYNGPKTAHANTNWYTVLASSESHPRETEYSGAIFLGLKRGLYRTDASLNDMGEQYRYRKHKHFDTAYDWRKYGIATDEANNLNESWQWVIPKEDRNTWSSDVHIGFMTYNIGQTNSAYSEYNTTAHSSASDIKEAAKYALEKSDKYVIYYCENQNWLGDIDSVSLEWKNTFENLYNTLHN